MSTERAPAPPATPDRAASAAAAEASVSHRHLRRFWAYPQGRLGVITWPAPWRHRLFVHYNYWWQAHLLDCLIDAQLRAPDARRRHVIEHLPRALLVRNRGTLVNDYFDDVAWLALAMGRVRDELGLDPGWRDLHLARHLYLRWRADAAGGGIPWRKGDVFRNVPANGSMAIVMARRGRHARTRDTVEWIYRHLHDPDTGMILEGRRPEGPDRRLYTYNQGLVLGALLELVLAGDESARPRLHALVAVIARRCAEGGVLNPCGGGDGGLFAAITARYLARTALLLPGTSDADAAARTTSARLVRTSADAAWDHRAEADGPHGVQVWFGDDWRVQATVPSTSSGTGWLSLSKPRRLSLSPRWLSLSKPPGRASDTGVISSDPPNRDLSVQLAGWMIQELAASLDRAAAGPVGPPLV